MYYFDYDQARADYISQHTHSGHFGINMVITHVAQDDLPLAVLVRQVWVNITDRRAFGLSHERSVMSNPNFIA